MKLIPLKYDFCIKEVMENETVRRHFISDVLAIPLKDIKSVRMINPFLCKRYKKQKLDILELHTIELKKKPDKGQPGPLDEWHSLFNAKTEEELDMLNQTGVPEIQKAVVILHEMSLDEEVQEMARLREKWILDENSALGNAERRKERELIEKMRRSGMTEEQIQKVLNS